MPHVTDSPTAEYRLEVRLESHEASSSESSALLLGWLAVDGISNATALQATDKLGPADWVPLLVSGTASLTALVTSLANLSRARSAKIIVRGPDGRTTSITGPVSRQAMNSLVQDLGSGATGPQSPPHASD